MLTDLLGRVAIRCGQILIIVIVVALAVYALIQLKLVVIPLLIALIVAAALSPVVNWLRRRGVSAILATWIVLLGGLAVVGTVIWLIVNAVRNQWDELYQSGAEGVDEVQRFLAQTDLPIDQEQITSIRDSVVDFFTSSQFGTTAIAGVSAATQLFTGLLLGFVILFFFLKDGGLIWNFLLQPLARRRHERGERIGHTAVNVLGGYARGTAIIAFVDAVAIGIGMLVLQVPLALPLTVVIFLGGFVPIVGATITAILAILVALVSNGLVPALILAAIVIVVQQLEGNFLQPVVMSRSISLHPLVILFALTAGTILAGIIGAVIAVPICAVAWAIIKVWNEPGDPSGITTPALDDRTPSRQVAGAGMPAPALAGGASAAVLKPEGKTSRIGRRSRKRR